MPHMSLFRNFLNPKSKSDKGQDKPETSDRSKYMPDVKLPTDERFMLNFKNNGGKFLYCESDEEIERLFKSLSDGGTVIMPVADQFWGAKFGMLKDRYNVHWMFNFEKGS